MSSGVEPREEILQCAASLFSSKGLGATRLSDIAMAVGVSAPTLYYHFENLDAIVETLLRYVVEESAAFATVEAHRPGRCADRLSSLLVQHVTRLTSGPYDLWFVAGVTEADALRLPFVTSGAQQWREAVLRLVAEGITAGEFRDTDPQLALAMVTGMVYGALQLRHELGTVDATEVSVFVVRSLAAPRRKKARRSEVL